MITGTEAGPDGIIGACVVVGGARTIGGLGRALNVEGLGWKTPSEGSAAPLEEVVEEWPLGWGVRGERGGMTTGGEMEEEEEGRGRGVVEGREVGDVR